LIHFYKRFIPASVNINNRSTDHQQQPLPQQQTIQLLSEL